MTFSETIAVAASTAALTALFTALIQSRNAMLQRKNDEAKFLREKLIELYSDFVAALVVEYDRARTIESKILSKVKAGDIADIAKLDDQRHDQRKELAKLATHIRLIDTNNAICEKANVLAKSQPYLVFLDSSIVTNEMCQEHFGAFSNQINHFELLLDDFIDSVIKVRSQFMRQYLAVPRYRDKIIYFIRSCWYGSSSNPVLQP